MQIQLTKEQIQILKNLVLYRLTYLLGKEEINEKAVKELETLVRELVKKP